MPFRRNRRRRYGRRKYRKTKAPNKWAWYAKMAFKGVKFLKGIINSEKHYQDTLVSQTTVPAGTVSLLSGMPQGDDVENRQGNSILAKTLYFRGTLARNILNTSSINSVRFMIIKDMENTGTAPTVTDVLQTATVYAPLNVDHLARYQVLMDKVYSLSLNGSMGINLKGFKRINDHIKYTGPLATDVYKNNLYLILITDQGAAGPGIDVYFRLGFYDN